MTDYQPHSIGKVVRSARKFLRGSRDPIRKELVRLYQLPRYQPTTTNILGQPIRLPDAPSFIASWREIFENRIYDFKSTSDQPRILDCGSNIGISCIFFKTIHPNSRITAFEPDPQIFTFLQDNILSHRFSNVNLVNKAVWNSDTTLKFECEGSDAGKICNSHGDKSIIVETVRLLHYLNEPIDLLKLDIEGAECDVIEDIAPALSKVKKIFVEYHSFVNEPQRLNQLIDVLTASGYRIQIQHVSLSSSPFIKIHSNLGMDLQLNIFAFRP
jgi:FkbM family methyltransferase